MIWAHKNCKIEAGAVGLEYPVGVKPITPLNAGNENLNPGIVVRNLKNLVCHQFIPCR